MRLQAPVRSAGAWFVALLLLTAVDACYHAAPLPRGQAEIAVPAVYSDRCSSCHGKRGRGDGLVGRLLPARSRDFGNADWQRSVSNEQIRRVIREGGRAVGLSSLMRGYADLSEEQVDGLIDYIRRVGAISNSSDANGPGGPSSP
jgi:mono/diheme cytochrome c family protein